MENPLPNEALVKQTVRSLTIVILGIELLVFFLVASSVMDHDPYGIGFGLVVLPMPLVFIAIHAIVYFFSGLSGVPARRLVARNTLKYAILMWAVLVIIVLSFTFISG